MASLLLDKTVEWYELTNERRGKLVYVYFICFMFVMLLQQYEPHQEKTVFFVCADNTIFYLYYITYIIIQSSTYIILQASSMLL